MSESSSWAKDGERAGESGWAPRAAGATGTPALARSTGSWASGRTEAGSAEAECDEAEKELKDQLEELRRQAEEEKLVMLQAELKKIIEAQEGVLNKATRDLDGVRVKKGALNREEVIRAKSLGKAQANIKSKDGAGAAGRERSTSPSTKALARASSLTNASTAAEVDGDAPVQSLTNVL